MAPVSPPAPSPPSERDTAPRHEGWAPVLCAVLGVVVAGLLVPSTPDFALDDAWIHLAYAKSLRLGEGLSYNPGDWETGFSSPLWVALLAVWPMPARGDPVASVQMLGALVHGLAAWAGAGLVLDLGRQRAGDEPLPLLSLTLLGGTFVATTPMLLHGAPSGMEVGLAAALMLWGTRAVVCGRTGAAAILGALAVWARPEALGYAVALGTLLAAWRWRRGEPGRTAAIAHVGGAAAAMGAWVAYCLAVSGHPLPNAHYVKSPGGGLDGLAYVVVEVLPWQVWLVSLTGVVLLGLAVLRDVRVERVEVAVILLAATATGLAIAVSRPLHPGVQFYEARYFAILAGIPAALVPLGLVGRGRWSALALVLPIAVLTGLTDARVASTLAEQADDTRTLHTDVARFVQSELPPDAVVAVEGAGAPRYFAPRTMTIVDLVGLNDATAAHLHFDAEAKMCHFLDQGITHLAIPADWVPLFGPAWRLRPRQEFVDARYTQVHPPRPLATLLFTVVGPREPWVARCGASTRPD